MRGPERYLGLSPVRLRGFVATALDRGMSMDINEDGRERMIGRVNHPRRSRWVQLCERRDFGKSDLSRSGPLRLRSKPIIFNSYDMSPILFGKGKSDRPGWFCSIRMN